MKIKIMIVDDHPFVRIAFKQIFREDSNILFSGESDNGLDFIELVKNSTPDIAIIDLQLPGMSGHDVISQIHNEYPEVKIIAFSAFFDLTNQNKAIKNGAFATISKTEPKKAVREAILGVIEGKSFHSKAVTFFDHGKESNEDNLELLSTREEQILLLISEGLTSKKIAEQCNISPKTVDKHRSNLKEKLGIQSLAELIRFAIKRRDLIIPNKIPSYETLKNLVGELENSLKAMITLKTNLENRTNIFQTLTNMSFQCMNIPIHKIENAIQTNLSAIGRLIDADRAYIFKYDFKKNFGINTYEWCAPGIEPEIQNLQKSPIKDFGDWITNHRNRQPVIIPSVANLPAGPMREILHKQGIKSLLSIPIFSEDMLVGFIGFDSVKKTHEYSSDEIETARIFSEMIVNLDNRKKFEKQLKESEINHRLILETMKDQVYIVSSGFKIKYMNPKMITRIGKNAVGEYCFKTIYNQNEKCSWCVMDQIQQGEQVEYERFNSLDNRYYSVTNSPIYNSEDSFPKLTICRDITNDKKNEEQLRQSLKMESIATMAGGIAHNFNNILYMIIGNAELAMEDIPAWNPVQSNLEEIKSAGLRASGIVKQLVNFSRNTPQELKSMGIVTVVKDALKFIRSTIPTSIEIRENLPDSEITIFADPIQINQVLANVCTNASQAMGKTGGILEVTIETGSVQEVDRKNPSHSPPKKNLKIIISDNGPGINPQIIDRIYDPYFTTKDVGIGSGMGLAVVHAIMNNHNGTINVASQPGEGTTVTIYFPIPKEEPVDETESSE